MELLETESWKLFLGKGPLRCVRRRRHVLRFSLEHEIACILGDETGIPAGIRSYSQE